MRIMNTGMRDPKLKISMKTGGCFIDTVQGFSGATVGNGRLTTERIDARDEYLVFIREDQRIRVNLKSYSHLTPDQTKMMDSNSIFTIIKE